MALVDDLAFGQSLILKSSAAGWSLAETSRDFCLEKHIASRNSVATDVSRVFLGNEKYISSLLKNRISFIFVTLRLLNALDINLG